MNISCDIIRDLLPLYAEDMVSQDSKDLVDGHLCGCDSCTKELAQLLKQPPVAVDAEPASLKRVSNTIRRRRVLSVLTALMMAVTVMLGISFFLDAPVYLTADQAVDHVQAFEDGTLHVHWKDGVVGTGSFGRGDMNGDTATGNYGVIAYTRMRKLLFKTDEEPSEVRGEQVLGTNGLPGAYGASAYNLVGGASNYNLWYVDFRDGTGETLIWDAGNPYEGYPLTQVNDRIGWLVAIMAGFSVLFWVIGEIIIKGRGKAWQRELCFRIGALTGSLSLSVAIVSAGQFVELWGEVTAATKGTVLAIPMTFACIFARQLYLLNHKDNK